MKLWKRKPGKPWVFVIAGPFEECEDAAANILDESGFAYVVWWGSNEPPRIYGRADIKKQEQYNEAI